MKLILKITLFVFISATQFNAQKLIPFRLPDTGQNTGYTSTSGEDADFIINPMSFTDNGDGTITDNITGLMWQKADGGEMTVEGAAVYCRNLRLAGYSDWRLPTAIELFSILSHDKINPAMNSTYFTSSLAEYWWSSDRRGDDTSKVWVANGGGGIGAHPKTETISAGGSRRIHVRGVRNPYTTTFSVSRFTDLGNGTIKDNYTGLIWQKVTSSSTMTWEEALAYSKNFTLAGKSDWRIPNIKELHSLNDPSLYKPSFNKTYFPNVLSGNYWSSTTLIQTTTRAWDINLDYGIVSYNDKTAKEYVILVRGGIDNSDLSISEVKIPAGEYEMGDHFGFVDPSHPSDELPLHRVKINDFYMAVTETTNSQFIAFLNSALSKGLIEVRNNAVYAAGKNDIYCYTNQTAKYYSISFDGSVFSIADFRGNHPVVGVMWFGAAAFCNWLSLQNGMQECYNLTTWGCDFTKNGYRLPTEAEWEWGARGGQTNPYFNYPWGNDQTISKANWPNSLDPYEGTNESSYPFTTPVGFYNGRLHLKSEYNWPGSASTYQTANSVNAFGLYDAAGNVWELVNDWYGNSYYSVSIYDNPKGPDSGFIMPDGKAYRGMRGGNWYNGYSTTSINDGHSRVSNRNPSYYRGPQDPNHPWYHVGFRTARNFDPSTTSVVKDGTSIPDNFVLHQNYPNPFNPTTTIKYEVPAVSSANSSTMPPVSLKVYDTLGREIAVLVNEAKPAGSYMVTFNAGNLAAGVYLLVLKSGFSASVKKMILMK